MTKTTITPARERAAARLLAKLPCTANAMTPAERREITRLERAGRIYYQDDLWQRALAPDFDTRDREGQDPDPLQEDYPGQRIAGPEATPPFTVKVIPNDTGNPPGRLAEIELHFHDGPLAGLKLIGFAVWARRGGAGMNVTFPARQYSVNGERRSFALLRPDTDPDAQNRIRDLILEAYAEWAMEPAVEPDAEEL